MTVFQLRAVESDAEALVGEELRERRPLHAVRIPRVELAAVDHEPRRPDLGRLQLSRDLRRQPLREEADEVARAVRRHVPERVPPDHRGKLRPRPDEHSDLHAEARPRAAAPAAASSFRAASGLARTTLPLCRCVRTPSWPWLSSSSRRSPIETRRRLARLMPRRRATYRVRACGSFRRSRPCPARSPSRSARVTGDGYTASC